MQDNTQMPPLDKPICSAVFAAATADDVIYNGMVPLNPSESVNARYRGSNPVRLAAQDGLIKVGDSVIGHGGGQQYLMTLLFCGAKIQVWYLKWRSIHELPLPPMKDGGEQICSRLPDWMEWFYEPNVKEHPTAEAH